MLSLPDEMILEFLQKYPQHGRSKSKSFRTGNPTNSDNFNSTHSHIASNLSNLNGLYRICLVCRRLYRLAMPLLYRLVVLNSADTIYLFLRTVIENPDLARYTVEITLNGRCGIQEGHVFRRYAIAGARSVKRAAIAENTVEEMKVAGKAGRKRESKLKRGVFYELKLSAQDVQQLSTYAQRCGLAEKYIRSLESGDRNFGEIISILLTVSLPSLESLQVHQDHIDKHRVFDQLLLEFIRNPQLSKISDRLTEFQRVMESVFWGVTDSVSLLDEIIPAILIPSIRTLTIAKACRPISDRDEGLIDFHTLIDTYSESSPVESIYVHDCPIDGAELGFLLNFPRSLRLLSLVPRGKSNPLFSPIQSALMNAKTNILDNLVTLHIGRAWWKMKDYDPSGFFRLFIRLERLAVPVELLLINGWDPLKDWRSFFPHTLVDFTFYALNSNTDPYFDYLCPLIEQEIESKRRGEGSVSNIGSNSWLKLYPRNLVRLISRAEEVGVRLAQVNDVEKPFDYDEIKQEEVFV